MQLLLLIDVIFTNMEAKDIILVNAVLGACNLHEWYNKYVSGCDPVQLFFQWAQFKYFCHLI
jgi:hypothetical protein